MIWTRDVFEHVFQSEKSIENINKMRNQTEDEDEMECRNNN